MSDLYKESHPHVKDLKNCLECNNKTTRDVFQQQLERGKKLFEAIVCDKCQIIWERIKE